MEISPQLKPQLSLFDIASYGEMYNCTSKNCFHEGVMGIVIDTLTGSMVQVLVTIATVFGGLYGLQLFRDCIHNNYFNTYLVLMMIAAVVLTLLLCILMFFV